MSIVYCHSCRVFHLLAYRVFSVSQNSYLTGLRSAPGRLPCERGNGWLPRARFTPEIVNPFFKKKLSKQEHGGSFNVMFPTEGRTERRIRLNVPLELSKLQYPNDAEATVTENISSIGARVLSWRPIEPDERLMIKFLELNLRTQARVVYCERLRHGQFAVGLQFQGLSIAKGTKEF